MVMMRSPFKMLVLLGLLCGYASAQPHVVILGLFKDKAIVKIDGEKRVLAKGETSPEGYTLVSANPRAAVLEYQGESLRMELGQDRGVAMSAPQMSRFQIFPDEQGMYRGSGSINGRRIGFLIDTGATFVALSRRHAAQLQLQYKTMGEKVRVTTASGVEPAYKIKLDRVQLGPLSLTQVEAIVIDGDYPQQALLGMSFLNRVKLERDGQAMVLQR